MDDTRQIKAISVFCSKPSREQAKGRPERKATHDWAHLAREIAYFDCGKTCDEATAKEIAKVLRKNSNFPNGSDWDERVSAPGAQERILELIRNCLAAPATGS
jgi:hypothetical protein